MTTAGKTLKVDACLMKWLLSRIETDKQGRVHISWEIRVVKKNEALSSYLILSLILELINKLRLILPLRYMSIKNVPV